MPPIYFNSAFLYLGGREKLIYAGGYFIYSCALYLFRPLMKINSQNNFAEEKDKENNRKIIGKIIGRPPFPPPFLPNRKLRKSIGKNVDRKCQWLKKERKNNIFLFFLFDFHFWSRQKWRRKWEKKMKIIKV